MRSLVFLLTLFLSVVVVSGSPVATELAPELIAPSSNWPQSGHQLGRVHVCTGTNWTGHCEYLVHPLDSCNVLDRSFKHNIGSFAPDPCTLCFAYETSHCSFGDGFFWMFQSPGNATGGIGVPNNAWITRISSFKCWPSPDCMG
ncbi:hypothetical protein L227DRAFT_576328 [Lentinus tigrinus ALCF2SS1-6]|uniref:Uncharacterized protein n=1 Tax=Lentinus tigrinus ALCF2SS1-6 TaxID=1328759 RepID=A0A5C2S6P8_9APHY|nr:hypothetical protein L227DRAFT_576328 [Lentinus tigrinus ALCF2SS1-6]